MHRALVLAAVCGLTVSKRGCPGLGQGKTRQIVSARRIRQHPLGSRNVEAFVAYPEVAHKATTVLVVYEIFGLTDWAKLAVDEFAAAGYIAIAPDFLSGHPKGGEPLREISSLPEKQVMTDLDAAFDYASVCRRPTAVVVAFAGPRHGLFLRRPSQGSGGSLVFYGRPPQQPQISELLCPVYGFYGEKDMRITATVDATKRFAADAGKARARDLSGGGPRVDADW